MFIGDETAGRHKRDNFPKDRVILSLVLSPLDGLSLDMMVVLDQELSKTCSGCTVCSSHGKGQS